MANKSSSLQSGGKNRRDEYGLTMAERAFADLYLADSERNATEAWLHFHPKAARASARVAACNALKRPHVKAYIEQRLADMQAKVEVSQERVLQEYMRLAFFDIRRLYHADGRLKAVNELDDETAAALASLDVKVENTENGMVPVLTMKYRFADKRAALHDLGTYLKMFKGSATLELSDPLSELMRQVVGTPQNSLAASIAAKRDGDDGGPCRPADPAGS